MMRSLYSGVSGMQNHQTRMDVLGNNIANVNTTGFKRGRVNFQDLLSQQMSGAARPTDELGGVNPKEVGLCMNVASIDTIHTQGSLQTTGIQTDIAIQGNGFFVMKSGEKTYFTRAGTFGVDSEGTLVNPANGMRVQGWQAQDVDGQFILNTSAQTEDLSIPVGQKISARATTSVNYACNLDKRLPEIPEGASRADVINSTSCRSAERRRHRYAGRRRHYRRNGQYLHRQFRQLRQAGRNPGFSRQRVRRGGAGSHPGFLQCNRS